MVLSLQFKQDKTFGLSATPIGQFANQIKRLFLLLSQLWRKWNNKIISKYTVSRKRKVAILTLDSDDTLNAKTPNNDENQNWDLISIE